MEKVSGRSGPKNLRSPKVFFQQIMNDEASGGIVLLLFTLVALIWANSPWQDLYHSLWEEKFRIGFSQFFLEKSLHHWINDGLMAIFFFVVGLEIKREALVGELSTWRNAAFPFAAAVGGMLVPAVIYLAFTFNSGDTEGWGIPMATDIAFAIGILSLMKSRVPASMLLFLTALAIVDDIGAVLVIAIFYTSEVHITPLLLGAGIFALGLLLNFLGARRPIVYIILFSFLWLAVLKSGIHATIAGVLAALFIPLRPVISANHFSEKAKPLVEKFHQQGKEEGKGGKESILLHSDHYDTFRDIHLVAWDANSPVKVLEEKLHHWVVFLIMPVFALANAGVKLNAEVFKHLFSPIGLGILFGLVLGKQIGVTLFSWLSKKMNLADMPKGASFSQVYGIGWIGGIGFTMSLFIANLAFQDAAKLETAKTAILFASLLAGVGGFIWFRFGAKAPH